MNYGEKALSLHEKWQGKIEVVSRVNIKTRDELSVAYTPGVAAPCLKIKVNINKSYVYTRRKTLVAVITD